MKYLIRFAFKGSNFYGTQRLKNFRTVQGEFEKALSYLYNAPIQVTIASRLDRGVNALDFAITFTSVNNNIKINNLKHYLSDCFKNEIYITNIQSVDNSFSPRYSCLYKTYCYVIQNSEIKNPLLNDISYQTNKKIDLDLAKKVISTFEGEHDFKYFASLEDHENTLLTVIKTDVKEENNVLYILFTAKAFLRYQVRFMVGALLSVNKNKGTIEDIQELLKGNKVKFPRTKAEPQGLYLKKIYYPTLEENELFSFPNVSFNI